MNDVITMPDTCFSCQHYQQTGWKEDPLIKNGHQQSDSIKQRKQRVGQCHKNNKLVFWNEKCGVYLQEEGIATYSCEQRPEPLSTQK